MKVLDRIETTQMFGLEAGPSIPTIGEQPAFRMGALAAMNLPYFSNPFNTGTHHATLYYMGWRAQRAFDQIERDKREAALWR